MANFINQYFFDAEVVL